MENVTKAGRLGAISIVIGSLIGIFTALFILSAIYESVLGIFLAAIVYVAVALLWLLTKNKPMGWLWVSAAVAGVLCPIFIPLLFIGAKRLAAFFPEGYTAPTSIPTQRSANSVSGANSARQGASGVTPKRGTRFSTEEPEPKRTGRFSESSAESVSESEEIAPKSGPRFGKTTLDNAKKEPTLFEIILDPDNDGPVELYNSDGKTFVMNQVATVPMDDKMYCLLTPRFHIDGIEDGVALGFEMTYVDGEERLMPLEAGEVYDSVYAEYEKMLEEQQG